MNDQFKLEIANIPVRVICNDQLVVTALKKRYLSFLSDQEALIDLEVNSLRQASAPTLLFLEPKLNSSGFLIEGENYQGYFDVETRQGRIIIRSAFPEDDLEYYLRVVYSLLAFEAGGLLFHSASIVRDGKAYVFFGHSGSGKTTVSRLSSEFLVLNDDLVFIKPVDDHWQVYATPFWNPTQVKPTVSNAPLAMLLRLVQDKSVFLETLSSGSGVAEMLTSVPIINADKARTPELMARCLQLVSSVPTYNLHFLPDASFWKTIDGIPDTVIVKKLG